MNINELYTNASFFGFLLVSFLVGCSSTDTVKKEPPKVEKYESSRPEKDTSLPAKSENAAKADSVAESSGEKNSPFAKEMIKAHQTWRSEVGAPVLKWSTALEKKAQNWANKLEGKECVMEHSGPGENLYWASPRVSSGGKHELQDSNPKKVVDSWGSEKQWYNYANNRCMPGKVCGHYTQVVWKKTTHVGCGKAVCGDASQVWVCNYEPAGNMIGEKPY